MVVLRKEPVVGGIGPVDRLLDSKGKVSAVLVSLQPPINICLLNGFIEKLEQLE
jgi:hypothetical protein